MNEDKVAVIQECSARSLGGDISFGQVVGKLMSIGVERYHADYTRSENTYYLPTGETLVVAMPHSPQPIAKTFNPAEVEASVRQAQRGEIVYPQFLQQTMSAGCVGYFVQITGRCVQYFGRNGEMHVEMFPSAPKT